MEGGRSRRWEGGVARKWERAQQQMKAARKYFAALSTQASTQRAAIDIFCCDADEGGSDYDEEDEEYEDEDEDEEDEYDEDGEDENANKQAHARRNYRQTQHREFAVAALEALVHSDGGLVLLLRRGFREDSFGRTLAMITSGQRAGGMAMATRGATSTCPCLVGLRTSEDLSVSHVVGPVRDAEGLQVELLGEMLRDMQSTGGAGGGGGNGDTLSLERELLRTHTSSRDLAHTNFTYVVGRAEPSLGVSVYFETEKDTTRLRGSRSSSAETIGTTSSTADLDCSQTHYIQCVASFPRVEGAQGQAQVTSSVGCVLRVTTVRLGRAGYESELSQGADAEVMATLLAKRCVLDARDPQVGVRVAVDKLDGHLEQIGACFRKSSSWGEEAASLPPMRTGGHPKSSDMNGEDNGDLDDGGWDAEQLQRSFSLPPSLRGLPAMLYHLRHGALLLGGAQNGASSGASRGRRRGRVEESADVVESLRVAFLRANVCGGMKIMQPQLLSMPLEGGQTGRQQHPDVITSFSRVPCHTTAMRSDAVLLLDQGVDIVVWAGRELNGNDDDPADERGAAVLVACEQYARDFATREARFPAPCVSSCKVCLQLPSLLPSLPP
jgi:hypothetical protein